MLEQHTYFYNEKEERIASLDGILPVTLFKGMEIEIHGYEEPFEVVTWSYHYVHSDEQPGLRILLKELES